VTKNGEGECFDCVRTQRIMLAYLLLIRINNVDAHGSSRPLRESGYILGKQEL
jgi:hypothetical protein